MEGTTLSKISQRYTNTAWYWNRVRPLGVPWHGSFLWASFQPFLRPKGQIPTVANQGRTPKKAAEAILKGPKKLIKSGYGPSEIKRTQALSLVQFSRSVMSDSVIPWTAACQASLSITNSRSLLKLMPIKSVMPSNHLILCQSLLLPPSIFPTIRVFSSGSVLRIRWPKYWSLSFSISPSNKYSGLIFFRIDWFDLTTMPMKLFLG